MSKARFVTTDWSAVGLGGRNDAQDSFSALEQFCKDYWYPLYAYARRLGYDCHSAEDATQGFFVHICESLLIAKADPAIGKFRTFLLSSFKNFLSSERKRNGALKRGGCAPILSLDELNAEERYSLEPSDDRSPDKLFDRNWALNLLERTLFLLEEEFQNPTTIDVFDRIKPLLVKHDDAPCYRQTAAELGMKEGTLKVLVHRMRRRHAEILRGLVAMTVSNHLEVEAELRHMVSVLGDC